MRSIAKQMQMSTVAEGVETLDQLNHDHRRLRTGASVWSGSVGTHLTNVLFDTVSMHVDDSAVMAARVPRQATSDEVLAALAGWWA